MNMEQRRRIMQSIRKAEILLAVAIKRGDMNEARRLDSELMRLVELL